MESSKGAERGSELGERLREADEAKGRARSRWSEAMGGANVSRREGAGEM